MADEGAEARRESLAGRPGTRVVATTPPRAEPFVLAAALVGLALWSGGYGGTAIGWSALLALWALLLGAVRARGRQAAREPLVLGLLLGSFVLWTFASALWSFSVPSTMLAAERSLFYAGAVGALTMAIRPRQSISFVHAVVVATSSVAVVALAEYLSDGRVDPTQGRLLYRPIGYANALGGFVALGIPVLLSLATGTAPDGRFARLARVSLVTSITALYLTGSRAAWLGAAVGVLYFAARARPRPRAASVAGALAIPGCAVAAVSFLQLTDASSGGDAGRRLAAAGSIAVAAVAAAAAPRALRRPLGGAATIVTALPFAGDALGDRRAYWHTAWRMFASAPLTGTGAGSFAAKWLQLRTVDRGVLYAHSVYLETLAELGLVGLCLLVAFLVLPVVSAGRRRDPMTCAAVGSYTVYLVHALFEWDWQMPALTLAALVVGAALLAAHGEARTVDVSPAARGLVVLAAAGGIAFSFASLVGHSAVVAAEHRLRDGDAAGAERPARRATRLTPWAAEPWVVLGDIHLRAGDGPAARAAYRVAIDRDPNDWQTWARLAVASSGAASRAAATRAAALDPAGFRPGLLTARP